MGFLALVWLLKFKSGLSRECFSEISQNFRSAGYMPSAHSILLQNSKNHLAILRLNFLCSNLKSNLQICVAETRTAKILNLNLRRESVKFKPAHSAATSHIVGDRGSLRGKGALLLQLRFATAKQRVIQAPSPLTRKIKYAVLNLIKPNLAFSGYGSRRVNFTFLRQASDIGD